METRRGPPPLLSLMLVVQLALLMERHVAVAAITNKCSACRSVAVELVASLAAERPRNHLDMRHRLDSRGVREGKVIDYKVSELRVVELLDGLCSKMKSYSLVKVGKEREWSKNNELVAKSKRSEMVANSQGKDLIRWCDRMLEEKEDELSAMIQNGDLGMHVDVEEVLCEHVTDSCPRVEDEPTPELETEQEKTEL